MAQNQTDTDQLPEDDENGGEQNPKRKFEGVRFLFSRRGRPTLIVVSVASLGALVVAVWLYGTLSGPDIDPRQQATEDVASGGSTDVEPQTGDMEGNLTSDDLTEDAKQAARQYNEQASEDGDLHPTPTFEDVEVIEVPEGEPQKPSGLGSNNEQSGSDQQTYTYTPPDTGSNSDSGSGDQQRRVNLKSGLNREELEQRREARRNKVEQLRNLYRSSPEIASVDMTESDNAQQGQQGQSGATAGQGAASMNATAPVSGQGMGGASPSGDTNQQARMEGGGSSSQSGQSCESPVVKAGEVVYANNDLALNTDHKGPVRMTFLQGELSGWKGMGQFQLNELGAKMNVTIDRLIAPNGQTFDANGYVLDPQTTLWAMSSDVDRHLIYRYGGFGLATILGGFQDLAEARQKKSETTSLGESRTEYREPDGKQVTWRLLGDFGEAFQEVFADNIDRPVTVTLDQNERAGVLFENTVCGPENNQSRIQRMRANGRADPVSGG